MYNEGITTDEANPPNNNSEKICASVPSECVLKPAPPIVNECVAKPSSSIANECVTKPTPSIDSDLESDCSIISNRHALSAGRHSNKRSERIKTLHKNLQVARDFRHPLRQKKNKMRPDSPLPSAKSDKTRIEELENIVLALRTELQLAKSSLSIGQRQCSVQKSVAELLGNDSYSDSEGDRTIIAQPNINASASSPSCIESGFTLVSKKKQSPKKTATTPAKQQQQQQLALPLAANIYDQLPCTSEQSNQRQKQILKARQAQPKNWQPQPNQHNLVKQPQQQKTKAAPTTNTNATAASTTSEKRSKRPPPIVAYDISAKNVSEAFHESLGHSNFTLKKVNRNCTHVHAESSNDHQTLCNLLANAEVPFHTFTPKDQRRTNLVLRNICSSYDAEDIKEAIDALKLNIKINNISHFATERSRRHKTNLRMWLIQLEPQSDIDALLRTTRLLNQIVFFEHRKAKGVAQCHNCQHFGHSSSNCSRPYRCVKCVETHAPGDCALNTLKENAVLLKATCVNCNQNHSANFRGCPAYIAYINAKSAKALQTQQQSTAKQVMYNNKRQANVSYAAATSTAPIQYTSTNQPIYAAPIINNSRMNNTATNNNMLDFIEAECADKFGLNLGDILAKANNFVPQYVTLPESAKKMALIKFALSLAPSPNNAD